MITVTLVLTLLIDGNEQRIEAATWSHTDMATLHRCDAIAEELGPHAACYGSFEPVDE